MSCVPIYNIHNVTLWSCPINRNVILAPEIASPVNNTPSSFGAPSPSMLATPSFNPSGPSPSILASPSSNPSEEPSPNLQLSPSPSRRTSPSPNLRSSPSPNVNTSPSSNLRSGPPPKVICHVVQINNTNHSLNNTNDSLPCTCPSHLEWLSLLAIIPLFCICACLWVKKRRAGLRIGNIYIPKITRRMRRSRSWPQLPTNLTNSPIDNRSRSEPVFDSIVL